MSVNNVLNTVIRPTVVFDATNKEHRYWAHRFIVNRTWAGCPWVFALPRSEDNVYNMVVRLVAEYYGDREFAERKYHQPEKIVPMRRKKQSS